MLSVFDLYFDALVKEILDQIAKISPLNFLDVDSNRPNTWASIKSLIPLPKVKTQTQKKSLRFSIIKMFNYLATESLLPKQVAKKKFFRFELNLGHIIWIIKMFSICLIRYCSLFHWAPLVESFDSYGVQGGKFIKLNILYKILYRLPSEFKSINQLSLQDS